MLTVLSRVLQIAAATLVVSIFVAGTARSMPADKKSTKITAIKKDVNDPAFQDQLLSVASQYKSYGKVDDVAHWAPTLCAVPPPPRARLSASKDVSTHGQKVYFLYARDPGQYFRDEAPKPGQVVVKESWAPASDSTGKAGTEPAASDKPLGLFVMMKLDPKTPDTDNGWVYGTISADGKSVTSAGLVQSCMGCHASASNDRLFGLVK